MEKKNAYAVITGASSGIGAEFAQKLAAEGFSLILVARRYEKLVEVKEEADRHMAEGAVCRIFTADLSKESECARLMLFLKDKRVGVFINNAGFGDCSYFPEGNLKKELSMIDVNIVAVHIMTKLILQKMIKQKGGYILNVASSAGLLPAGPYMSTYYATKAYVTSLTRGIARELKEKKINVYVGCLCPGPVETEFNDVAGATFALPGICAKYCVDYAVKEMKRKKTVIVPALYIQAAILASKITPDDLYIAITAKQQSKKMRDKNEQN